MDANFVTRREKSTTVVPMVRKRRLRFVPPVRDSLRAASKMLLQTTGVIAANPGQDSIDIEYDLRQVTFAQMEAIVAEEGLVFRGGCIDGSAACGDSPSATKSHTKSIRPKLPAAIARRRHYAEGKPAMATKVSSVSHAYVGQTRASSAVKVLQPT